MELPYTMGFVVDTGVIWNLPPVVPLPAFIVPPGLAWTISSVLNRISLPLVTPVEVFIAILAARSMVAAVISRAIEGAVVEIVTFAFKYTVPGVTDISLMTRALLAEIAPFIVMFLLLAVVFIVTGAAVAVIISAAVVPSVKFPAVEKVCAVVFVNVTCPARFVAVVSATISTSPANVTLTVCAALMPLAVFSVLLKITVPVPAPGPSAVIDGPVPVPNVVVPPTAPLKVTVAVPASRVRFCAPLTVELNETAPLFVFSVIGPAASTVGPVIEILASALAAPRGLCSVTVPVPAFTVKAREPPDESTGVLRVTAALFV